MKSILLSLSLLVTFNISAQDQDQGVNTDDSVVVEVIERTTPDTVKIGVFFTSVYDLNLADKSWTADFWIWYNYRNDDLNPLESIEISNSKEAEFASEDLEKMGDINWATHKCRAVIKKEWNLENFPFDKQELVLEIEDAIYDSESLIYVADTANSNFDKSITLDEWNIHEFKTEQLLKTYETTYGNPELTGTSEYPGLKATFILERDGIGLFLKLFVGVFVAYLISLCIFFMGPDNPERFGMIVGALFAGVANKYIVESLIPHTIMVTLPDKIHMLTFVFIILHLIVTLFVYRLGTTGHVKRGWKIDKISFIVSLLAFSAINLYWITDAINHTR